MALLTAYGLAKSFGDKQLFARFSFEVQPGDRIGLVGVNGCGKTTLFRILAGMETPSDGTVSKAKLCRIATLAQAPDFLDGISLYDDTLHASEKLLAIEKRLAEIEDALAVCGSTDAVALVQKQVDLRDEYEREGGLTYRSRTRAALLGLGFTQEDIDRPAATMSGGQLRKAALAKAILSDASLLLLDEPTNHLDIAAIEWLESALREYKGSCMVISHDRYFLDAVTTRTFEIENGNLRCTNLPYSAHVERKLDHREIEWRHYRNTLKEIKRIEGIIEQQRRWNQERNYITIASKQRQIDRIRSGLIRPESEPAEIHFELHAEPLVCNEVVVCKDLCASFGNKTVFENCSFMLRRDECVVLVGANGCGKTTLLNILLGKLQPQCGSYRLGTGVRVGHFSQETVSERSTVKVLEEMQNRFPLYDQKTLRNLLGAFLFRGDDVFKPMNALSGGEAARIQLLTLMLHGGNVLFLDEPTNHLDIPSREALEKALESYGGTMLIVTHDRYLANRLADRIVTIGYNGIEEFCGDWDDYKAAIAERALTPKRAERPKNSYVVLREQRAEISRVRNALRRAEKAVEEGENEMRRMEEKLTAHCISSDPVEVNRIYAQMDAYGHELGRRYTEWEMLEKEYRDLAGKDEQNELE